MSVGLLMPSTLALPVALSDDISAAVFFIVDMNALLRLDATRIDPRAFEPHSERGVEQRTLRFSCSPRESLEAIALLYRADVQVV